MKTTVVWIVIILIIVLGFVFLTGNEGVDTREITQINVTLDEQNESGVSGTAVLTETEEGVRVVVNLPRDVGTRPIHLHSGTCENLGGVTYPLTNVVDGASETVLEDTLHNISHMAPWAINVHESGENLDNYISCGELLETVDEHEGGDEGEAETSMKVPAPGNEGVDEMIVNENGEEIPADAILEAGDFKLVDYTDKGFVPKEITIKRGETIRFVNNSGGGMWVGSAIHPTHAAYPLKSSDNCLGSDFDQCDSSLAGSFWEFTFDAEGEHGYHNHVKASDWGKVIVE